MNLLNNIMKKSFCKVCMSIIAVTCFFGSQASENIRFPQESVIKQEQSLLLNIPFVLQGCILSFLPQKNVIKFSQTSKKSYNIIQKIMSQHLGKIKDLLRKEENPDMAVKAFFDSSEYVLFWSQRIDSDDLDCFKYFFEDKFFSQECNETILSENGEVKINASLQSWMTLGPKNRCRFLECFGNERSIQFQRALKLATFSSDFIEKVQKQENWTRLYRVSELSERFIDLSSNKLHYHLIHYSTYSIILYKYFSEIANISCRFNQLDELKEVLIKIDEVGLMDEKTSLYRRDLPFCKKFFLKESFIGKDKLLKIAREYKHQEIIDFLSPKKRIHEELLNDANDKVKKKRVQSNDEKDEDSSRSDTEE